VNRYGVLDIGVPNWTPTTNSSFTYNEGSVERWSVDGARSGAIDLGKATLQIAHNQPTANATITLNGGGIEGWIRGDDNLDARFSGGVMRVLNPNLNFIFEADSFVGSRYYLGANGLDMGRQTHDNRPMEEYLASGVVLDIQGTISGVGGLTKSGIDLVILSGANTYEGATFIESGRLMIGRDNALPTTTTLSTTANGVLDLNGQNQTVGMLTNPVAGTGPSVTHGFITNASTTIKSLTVGNGAVLDSIYSGVIQHNIALVKTGPATLTLTNNNTYRGNTTINEGTLAIANDGNLGLAPIGFTAENLVFTGGLLGTTTSLTWNPNRGLFIASNSGGFAPALGTTLTLNSAVNAAAGTAFVKAGEGTLLLNTADLFYDGETRITGGTLVQGVEGAILAGSRYVITGDTVSGTLDLNGFDSEVGSLHSAGLIPENGQVLIGANTLTLGADETTDGLFSGVISGTGSLVKVGVGTQTLTGINTYTGQTMILGGILAIGQQASLGPNPLVFTPDHLVLANGGLLGSTTTFSLDDLNRGILLDGTGGGFAPAAGTTLTVVSPIGGSAPLIVGGEGTLILAGVNTFDGPISLIGGSLSITDEAQLGANPPAFNAAQLLLDDGKLITTADVTLDDSNRGITIASGGGTFETADTTTLTIDSIIAGTGTLQKTGLGTLVLTADNTTTGGTTITEGVLSISSEENLGVNPVNPGTGDLILNGGTLLTTADVTLDDVNRGVVLTTNNGTFNTATGTTLTIANLVSGLGSFNKVGAGTLVLQNNNTYEGTTTVSAGVLEIATANALGLAPAILAPAHVTLDGGTLRTTGTLDLGVNRGLNVGVGGGTIDTATGTTLTLSAPIAGTGALTKSGAGTAILTAVNNHSGDLTIGQGALFLDGGSLASSTVTVAAGATFGGLGTVSGPVTLEDGVLGGEALFSVGGQIRSGLNVLTLENDLTLGEFTIVDFYLSQTGFTQLNVLGDVTLTATTRFRINLAEGYFPSMGSNFQLITPPTWAANLGITDWASYLILPTLPGDTNWVITDFGLGSLKTDGVAAGPVITDPASGVVLYGDSVTFTTTVSGSDPILVQWFKGPDPIPGATSTTFTIPSVVDTDAGAYKLVATNGTATAESQVAVLDVVTAPRFVTQLADLSAYPQTSPVLSVDVLAPGDVTYAWFVDLDDGNGFQQISGASGVGSTFASYQVPALVPNAAPVRYKVSVVADINGLTFGPSESEMTLTVLEGILIDPSGQPQNATVSEGRPATFTVAATGDFGIGQTDFTYQWQSFNGTSWVNIEGETADTLTVIVPAVVAGQEAGRFRAVVSNPYASVNSAEAILTAGVAQIVLAGPGQPAAQIVRTGEDLEITIDPAGAMPMTFQWLFNGVAIPGQTSNTLWIPAVTLNQSGLYSCVVSNTFQTPTGRGSDSKTTDQAAVTIVDSTDRHLVVREPGRATLSVTTRTPATAPVSFQWSDANGAIIGANAATLAVDSLSAGNYSYFCTVSTTAAGSADGGVSSVFVFNSAPVWPDSGLATTTPAARLPLPNARVGEPYFYQLPLPGQTVSYDGNGIAIATGTPTGATMPTGFKATGLPAGLTINSRGQITGTATVDGNFNNVTITMSNGLTPAPAPLFASLTITGLSDNVIGEFTGPVERHPLNGNLGGLVTVRTNKKGAYTGSVVMGAKTYRFKGALVSSPGSSDTTATVTVSRGRTLPALSMTFALDAATQVVSVGEIKEITDRLNANVATFTGWRYAWTRVKGGPKFPARDYNGYYTLGLELPTGLQGTIANPSIPQGTGYASFTVNAGTGRTKVSGRLSDGTAFTTATYVGPDGQVAIFRPIYSSKARGSVLGSLIIDKKTVSATPAGTLVDAFDQDNTLEGEVSWWKPAQAGRAYAAGFGPIDLTAVGSRYVAPGTGVRVMGLVDPVFPSTINSVVELVEANVENAGLVTTVPAPNQTGFNVAINNRAVADVLNNPRRMTLTINARTGLLTGRFSLSEAHPHGGTPSQVNRTVSYQAMIIGNGVTQQGFGYFLLPQLPSSQFESTSVTPILSGQVTFDLP
jgi:autotransporter-associated beta strand protein